MKKLWLTACAAACFGIACMAQEQQDSTRNQSNQYRNNANQSDSTDRVQGSKSTRIHMQTDNSDSLQNQRTQTSGEHLGNEINEIDSAATDSLNNNIDRADKQMQNRSNFRHDVDSARTEIKNDADRTSQQLRNEGERTGNRLKSDAEKVRDDVNESTTRTRDSSDNDATQNQSGTRNNNQSSGNTSMDSPSDNQGMAMSSPVEVVPDKEGPNNEVVYKFRDEMYYVDREKKEMVKVEGAELKDSKAELTIHEGPITKDVAKAKRKSHKG
jgi:hypothetical protein